MKRAPLFFALLIPLAAQAAPIGFDTALPVARGEYLTRAQYLTLERSMVGGPAEVEAQMLVGVAGYGLTPRLAVFSMLPWFLKHELRRPGVTQEATGLGDLTLFGRYTVYQDDAPGRTFRVAPLLGITAPTGEDDETDAMGRLPRPLQPGAGGWAGFGGGLVTWQTRDWQTDAQLQYRYAGTDEGYQPGDVIRLDASLQYRVLPRRIEGWPGFTYAVIEGSWLHEGRDEIDGSETAGGERLLLAPGLQYVGRRSVWEAQWQFTAADDLRAGAFEDDQLIRLSLRWAF